MANIAAFSQVSNAALSLGNLILVSPQATQGYQPQNAPTNNGTTAQPPPALLFHYEGEQTANLESDITDHYVEDNTALQDQIALRPEEISTHGFIGELNDVAPAALAAIQQAANKLTTLDAYTPSLSASALIAYNQAFQLYQAEQNAANAAVSAWGTIANAAAGGNGESIVGSNGLTAIANQNKQQTMFQQLYGYWRNRVLFTVQTPWAVFTNMAIKRLVAIQDETTRVITDFNLTFKMIRLAQTQTSVFDPTNLQGRAAAQGAGLTNLGINTPPSSLSLVDGLSSNYPGLGVRS